MKYDKEKLNSMNIDELVHLYLHYGHDEGYHLAGENRSKSDKKKILKALVGSRKFEMLISKLDENALKELISIHPNKEYVLDSITHAIESNGILDDNNSALNFTKMIGKQHPGLVGRYYYENARLSNDFYDSFNKKSTFDKFKEMISGKKTDLTPKIEKLKELEEIQLKRKSATGKKYEKLEKQAIDFPAEEARVEVKDSEMTKIFDKYAKLGREKGDFTSKKNIQLANEVKENMKNKYVEYLGKDKEDIAELLANSEFENYSGNRFFVPYGDLTVSSNSFCLEKLRNNTIGVLGNQRSWTKNLLEVEKIDNFSINDNNYGTIYVVKSEFSPTEHAIKGKWAPIYEYYKKNSNGEFIRIGFGKFNVEKNEMETTITKDISGNIDNVDRINQVDDSFITLNTSEIKGESTKLSRKNIDETIVKKSIQDYLGKDKTLCDLTQVKDFKIVEADNPHNDIKNYQVKISTSYAISYLDNGKEVYKIVSIDEDGNCKEYPNMKEVQNENLYFSTGISVGGYDLKSSLDELKKRDAIQSYSDNNGNKYSMYRDNDGTLRLAKLVEHSSGNIKIAENLDTYSLAKGDIKKLKEEYEKSKSKLEEIKNQKNHLMALQEELENTNSLSTIQNEQDGLKM